MSKHWGEISGGRSSAYYGTSGLTDAKKRELAVSHLIERWAQTSGDSNPLSIAAQLAAQLAAQDEFQLNHTYQWWAQAAVDQAKNTYGGEWDGIRAFLRAMYENTQDQFRAQGVTHVPLVRGFAYYGDINGVAVNSGRVTYSRAHISLQPMSSFSADVATANGFAGGGLGAGGDKKAIIYGRIPVERIVGTARSGYGCQNEYEFVVLGGGTDDDPFGIVVTEKYGTNLPSAPATLHDLIKKGMTP